MHLYSNNLSSISKISSLIISELLPASFSSSKTFILSQNSLGSDHKNVVFETPEAQTNKLGDLINFISVRSRVGFLPCPLSSKCISFAKSYINFLSDKLARSTL